jgi:hypothetical protein
MTTVDPNRIGGLAWMHRTQGVLSASERRRLLGEIVRGQAGYIADRIKLAAGRIPDAARRIGLADFRPPDSALAKAAEEACRELTAGVIGHSYRTWAFGSGLAALDGEELEPEQFYVASLLHDHGIVEPVAGQDFTARSAERAQRCAREAGTPEATADAIAQAITVHATPGASAEHDGALGFYVQAGALFDLVGVRAADLAPPFVLAANSTYPRDGVTAEITRLIRAEAKANPRSRFALLHRCGFSLMVPLAPHRPR